MIFSVIKIRFNKINGSKESRIKTIIIIFILLVSNKDELGWPDSVCMQI